MEAVFFTGRRGSSRKVLDKVLFYLRRLNNRAVAEWVCNENDIKPE